MILYNEKKVYVLLFFHTVQFSINWLYLILHYMTDFSFLENVMKISGSQLKCVRDQTRVANEELAHSVVLKTFYESLELFFHCYAIIVGHVTRSADKFSKKAGLPNCACFHEKVLATRVT